MHCSADQPPKVVGAWYFYHLILTSTCASRHNCAHFFRHLNLNFKKALRDRQFFTLLTSKCASRHKGLHFFNISTSKSALNLVCLAHFDLGMWFVPQRPALFQQLNFKKWRHNDAHFSDITTSKSAPTLKYF